MLRNIMTRQLENLANPRWKVDFNSREKNQRVAGFYLLNSAAVISAIPTIYFNMPSLENVDKFGAYYTAIMLTAAAIALPMLGFLYLKRALKKPMEPVMENVTLGVSKLQSLPVNNILN